MAPLEASVVTRVSTAPFLEGGSAGTEVPPGTLPPPTLPLFPYLTAAAGGPVVGASYPLDRGAALLHERRIGAVRAVVQPALIPSALGRQRRYSWQYSVPPTVPLCGCGLL